MLIVSNVLFKFLDQIKKCKKIIVSKAWYSIANLFLFPNVKSARKPGLWKGKVWMASDFDEQDQEIEKLFSEGSI